MQISEKFSEPIQDWLNFLDNSPSPFHAVAEILARINKTRVTVAEWSEQKELIFDQIYTVKGEGSVIAFYLPPKANLVNTGSFEGGIPLRLWGSHTDSPSLKLKPIPTTEKKPYVLVSSSVYGGPILNTWLDKPLAIAGQIFVRNHGGSDGSVIDAYMVNTADKGPRVVIPNAAIHLNRDINNGFKLVADTHLRALYASNIQPPAEKSNLGTGGLLADIIDSLGKNNIRLEDVLAHELLLFDPNPATLFGKDNCFINSRNLDNLAMVHAGIRGWIGAVQTLNNQTAKSVKKPAVIPMVAFFNHEEIGSNTFEGAASHLLIHVYEELYKKLQVVVPAINQAKSRATSLVLSADMAHGFHPNYEAWHEEKHRGYLNQGPLIKHNVNYRYAGSGAQIARVKAIMHTAGVPIQEYVHHSEIPCGSTIGPVLSSRLAMPTVDIGNPLLAMHSTRETAGVADHLNMIRVAENFFTSQ